VLPICQNSIFVVQNQILMKSFIVFLLILTSSAAMAQDAMVTYGEARKAEKEQNWNRAESLYSKAIKEDSGNAMFYYSRGNLNMLLGRDAKALPDINKAIELAPDDAKMILLKAQYFIYNELPDSAMLYIQDAEKMNLDQKMAAQASIARADAYRLLKDYEKSLEHYEFGLKTDTTNMEALENIALVLYELGDVKQAAHYLQQLLAVNPYVMDTYINVGYIYARIGMFLESLSYSEEALKFDAHHPIALANKAYALLRMESYDDALTTVNRSIKNNPTNPFALKTRAMILIATDGNKNRACRDLKNAQKQGYDILYDDGEVDALLEEHCN